MGNMYSVILLLLGLFLLFGLGIGVLLFVKPRRAIEMQMRFYERINWKVHPISMEKEMRNTKVMGFLLISFSLVSGIYVISSIFAGSRI